METNIFANHDYKSNRNVVGYRTTIQNLSIIILFNEYEEIISTVMKSKERIFGSDRC